MSEFKRSEIRTVGDELLLEIERVAAKRERWRQYQREADERRATSGGNSVNFGFGIAMMGIELQQAREAIASNDAVACIAALQVLRVNADD